MKLRGCISILIATMLLSQTTGMAAPKITKFTPYAGVITVDGTHEKSGENNVMFAVYPKEGERNSDTLAALGEVKSEYGEFNFKFGLDNSGDYVIVIKADGTTTEKVFSSAGISDLNDFVTGIQTAYNNYSSAQEPDENALISDIEDVFSDTDKKLVIETLGVDSAAYYAMSEPEKKKLFTLFVKNTDFSALNVEEVARGYSIAYDLYSINQGVNIQEILQRRNLSFEGSQYSVWSNGKQAGVARILYAHSPYVLYQNMVDGFQKACMLQNINEEHRVEKIYGVISGYANELQISADPRYTGYSNTDATNVKLIQLLTETPINTKEQLLETMQKAKTGNSNPSSGGGFGGGTGGSGGGGGGSSYYIGDTPKPDVVPGEVPDAQKSSFNDMSDCEWAIEPVERLVSKGVISGYGDSTFAPNQYVTREEFIKMLVIAFGVEYQDASCSFVDVFNTDWFYHYVGAAEQLNITQGITKDIFGVKTHIIRQDACVMLLRGVEAVKRNLNPRKADMSFRDENQIDEYAKDAIEQLYMCEIIRGDEQGNMNPKSNLTRAEAAKMIDGIMQEVEL